MTIETRLHKIETAVMAAPRTLDQMRREFTRIQAGFDPGMGFYKRWLGEMSDTELELFTLDTMSAEHRERFASLTTEELERVAVGDFTPLESRPI